MRKIIVAFAVMCCAALAPPALASPADANFVTSNSYESIDNHSDQVILVAAVAPSPVRAETRSDLSGANLRIYQRPALLSVTSLAAPSEVGALLYTA